MLRRWLLDLFRPTAPGLRAQATKLRATARHHVLAGRRHSAAAKSVISRSARVLRSESR